MEKGEEKEEKENGRHEKKGGTVERVGGACDRSPAFSSYVFSLRILPRTRPGRREIYASLDMKPPKNNQEVWKPEARDRKGRKKKKEYKNIRKTEDRKNKTLD